MCRPSPRFCDPLSAGMSSMSRALLLSFTIALFAVFAGMAQAAPPSGLAGCEVRFAAKPDDEASTACFYDVGAADPKLAPAVAARLEALLAGHPGHPWLSLFLGYTKTDTAGAVALYRAAAEGFAVRHEARGEVFARSNLQR